MNRGSWCLSVFVADTVAVSRSHGQDASLPSALGAVSTGCAGNPPPTMALGGRRRTTVDSQPVTAPIPRMRRPFLRPTTAPGRLTPGRG